VILHEPNAWEKGKKEASVPGALAATSKCSKQGSQTTQGKVSENISKAGVKQKRRKK